MIYIHTPESPSLKHKKKQAAAVARDVPKPNPRDRLITVVIAAFVLAVALVLLLANLGNQYLWQDEAETALVARSVLTHGVPVGFDGRNYYTQDQMENLGRNYVWVSHPWFQFYVAAAFFYFFGATTFIARLPFALFGAAAVTLTFFYGRFLWGTKRAGLIAALLLVTSVPYLILTRQCRYYPMGTFFTLASLFSYGLMVTGKKRSTGWFLASTLLLFHTQYTQWAAVIGAVVAHSLMFHRSKAKKLLLPLGINAIMCAPWIIWFASYAPHLKKNAIGTPLMFAGMYLDIFKRHIFSPIAGWMVVGTWLAVLVRKNYPFLLKKEAWKHVVLLVVFSLFSLTAGCVAAAHPWLRYIMPIIPLHFLLIAGIVDAAFSGGAALGAVAAAAMVIPILAGPLSNYFYEITHDYDGPMEGAVKFLNRHAKKTDVVAVTYGDLPVIFYTNLRVVSALSGEDWSHAKAANWAIIRRDCVSDRDIAFRDYLIDNLHLKQWRAYRLPYPDSTYENREEPDHHYFRTPIKPGVIVMMKPR